MNFNNKRVLITAGPTWVSIDDVRVISNIATGETGILLAEKLQCLGARVTLLLGPAESCCLNRKIRLIRFRFFDELKNKVVHELKNKKYDVVIHSAAVSDFRPKQQIRGKLSSEQAHNLKLVSLPKIIREIKRLASSARLVMFKLESRASDKVLIEKAKNARAKVGADIIVANRLNPYRAFIINEQDNTILVKNKRELINKLFKKLITNND